MVAVASNECAGNAVSQAPLGFSPRWYLLTQLVSFRPPAVYYAVSLNEKCMQAIRTAFPSFDLLEKSSTGVANHSDISHERGVEMSRVHHSNPRSLCPSSTELAKTVGATLDYEAVALSEHTIHLPRAAASISQNARFVTWYVSVVQPKVCILWCKIILIFLPDVREPSRFMLAYFQGSELKTTHKGTKPNKRYSIAPLIRRFNKTKHSVERA
jgi:hypothetical protein